MQVLSLKWVTVPSPRAPALPPPTPDAVAAGSAPGCLARVPPGGGCAHVNAGTGTLSHACVSEGRDRVLGHPRGPARGRRSPLPLTPHFL